MSCSDTAERLSILSRRALCWNHNLCLTDRGAYFEEALVEECPPNIGITVESVCLVADGAHQCPRHYQRMAEGLLRSHRWLLWTGNTPLHENTLRLSTEYCLKRAHPQRVDDEIIRKAAFVVGDRLETDVRSMSCGTETSNLMKCSEDHLFRQSHFSCDMA